MDGRKKKEKKTKLSLDESRRQTCAKRKSNKNVFIILFLSFVKKRHVCLYQVEEKSFSFFLFFFFSFEFELHGGEEKKKRKKRSVLKKRFWDLQD